MRRRPSPADNLLTFGGNVPPAVGGLIVALLAGSILAALSESFAANVAFVPAAVLRLQIWRLVTWVFVELQPINLVFGGLMLYWFGRDLAWAWGPRRFIATYLGIAAASAALTTVVALFLPELQFARWASAWPVLSALVIAWATIYPDRQLLFMFALPMAGKTLMWITIGGTVLYAIFARSVLAFLPYFAAEGLMLLLLRGNPLRGIWQTVRVRDMERRARKRAAHLKVVKKNGDWLN